MDKTQLDRHVLDAIIQATDWSDNRKVMDHDQNIIGMIEAGSGRSVFYSPDDPDGECIHYVVTIDRIG